MQSFCCHKSKLFVTVTIFIWYSLFCCWLFSSVLSHLIPITLSMTGQLLYLDIQSEKFPQKRFYKRTVFLYCYLKIWKLKSWKRSPGTRILLCFSNFSIKSCDFARAIRIRVYSLCPNTGNHSVFLYCTANKFKFKHEESKLFEISSTTVLQS